MSYISLTDEDREQMLAAIGAASIDELFRDVPAGVRFGRSLDVPPALAEADLTREQLVDRRHANRGEHLP